MGKFDDLYNNIITEKYEAKEQHKSIFDGVQLKSEEPLSEYELRELFTDYLHAFIDHLTDQVPLNEFVLERVTRAGSCSTAALSYLYSLYFYIQYFHKSKKEIYRVLKQASEDIDIDEKFINKKTFIKYYKAFKKTLKKKQWQKHAGVFRQLTESIRRGF